MLVHSCCESKSALRSQILRIERIPGLHKVRLRLSGQFRSHHLDQVKAEISRGEPIALDLEDVDLVDIEAIRFLNAREDEGIALLALYSGVDVEGAARRESSNGLAMMTFAERGKE